MEFVPVTKPTLPELEEYVELLREVWQNRWLTNNGPLLVRFKGQLAEALETTPDHLGLFANGTLALQLGLEALELPPGSEVITPTFTFPATAQAIHRSGLQPVFCDIDAATLNVDPAAAAAAVTPRTSALLAVHVFSRPCDHAALTAIAREHGLKLIYDAAAGLGTRAGGRPLSALGDLSMFSLHATKLFNCVEGGLLVAADAEVVARADRMQNFGLEDDGDVATMGTNAKLSELHVALGMTLLGKLAAIIAERRRLTALYRERLEGVVGFQQHDPEEYNYSYLPVRFTSEAELVRLIELARPRNIHPRRYYYPCLHQLSVFRTGQSLPVAEDVGSRTICLPLYSGLDQATVEAVCRCVIEAAA